MLKHPYCPKCKRKMMRVDKRRGFGEEWLCAGCGFRGNRAEIQEEKFKKEE